MNKTTANLTEALSQRVCKEPGSEVELDTLFRQHVIFSITDINGRITDVSDAFCSHTGFTQQELIGNRHNILRSESTLPSLYHSMWSTINDDKTWFGEVLNLKKDATPFWINCTITPLFDKNNNKTGYLAIYSNITREKEIEEESFLDELTQVYNRKKFHSCLDSFLENRSEDAEPTVLVMIDIDHFKAINDLYGHVIGDEMLITLSRFIEQQTRKSDLFCRWGGEEFIIAFIDTDIESANIISNKLCELIENDLELQRLVGSKLTASFGLVTYTVNDTEDSVISRADKAMYVAKNSGKNRVVKL